MGSGRKCKKKMHLKIICTPKSYKESVRESRRVPKRLTKKKKICTEVFLPHLPQDSLSIVSLMVAQCDLIELKTKLRPAAL